MAMKSVNLGTAARATDLLTGYGVDQTHFDRLVKDPAYRRQVGLAMTGQLTVTQITREEWVERELNILTQLHELGLPVLTVGEEVMRQQLDAAYNEEGHHGIDHRFVPGGLVRQMLLDASAKAGIKIGTDYLLGESLPTQVGVFDCNLTTVMQPVDGDQRPFMLDHDKHEAWSKDQGGDGISSAEEAQYLLLRMKLEFGRILFMGGWIRCKNAAGSGISVYVVFSANVGLGVDFGSRSSHGWSYGCVPRKFKALVA